MKIPVRFFDKIQYLSLPLIKLKIDCVSSYYVVLDVSYMDRVKRIWYLSPMRAAKVQAESQIPGPSEWLGMRS